MLISGQIMRASIRKRHQNETDVINMKQNPLVSSFQFVLINLKQRIFSNFGANGKHCELSKFLKTFSLYFDYVSAIRRTEVIINLKLLEIYLKYGTNIYKMNMIHNNNEQLVFFRRHCPFWIYIFKTRKIWIETQTSHV